MNDGDEKRRRVLASLERSEPDRVPVGEEDFWPGFIERAKSELGGGSDFNPYRHWDLDLVIEGPNMDPHITEVEVLEKTADRTIVRDGFRAVVEHVATCPMPRYIDFETKTWEQMEAFEFDDPKDERRYFQGLPPFAERVTMAADDFCVFGSVYEAHEALWRLIGSENLFFKLAEDRERVGKFAARLGDFLVGIVEGQIAAAEGRLSGFYVWGDIAYTKGMLFAPDWWRAVYKPQLRRVCDAVHAANLKVIYHGCGNASLVYEDLIEAGVDAYHPLEVKAGLDAVELKRRFGDRLALNGNIDVRVLATNDRDRVRSEVLRKLNAAKGGGYILQTDSAVPDDVDPHTYDYMVQLVREYGTYPLDLGEFDEAM